MNEEMQSSIAIIASRMLDVTEAIENVSGSDTSEIAEAIKFLDIPLKEHSEIIAGGLYAIADAIRAAAGLEKEGY